MTGMNRLSPWIVRNPRLRPLLAPGAVGIGVMPDAGSDAAGEDLRLFVTAWAAGLVFFGTLFA